MKPDDWNDLSQTEKRAYALRLFNSTRGYFLLNQALTMAAAAERNHGAISTAEDLEMLAEGLFPVDHANAELLMVPIEDLIEE